MATRTSATRGFAGKIAQASLSVEQAIEQTKKPSYKATADTQPLVRKLKAQMLELRMTYVYLQYQAGRTQGEIAEELGVTAQRVSQMVTATRRQLHGA